MASNTFLQRSIPNSSQVNTLSRACEAGADVRWRNARHNDARQARRMGQMRTPPSSQAGESRADRRSVRLRRPTVKRPIILGRGHFVKLFGRPKSKIGRAEWIPKRELCHVAKLCGPPHRTRRLSAVKIGVYGQISTDGADH